MAGSDAWAMLEIDMEVSINVGTQNRWLYIYIYKENPTKMDDLLGIPPFQEASKWKLHVGDIWTYLTSLGKTKHECKLKMFKDWNHNDLVGQVGHGPREPEWQSGGSWPEWWIFFMVVVMTQRWQITGNDGTPHPKDKVIFPLGW